MQTRILTASLLLSMCLCAQGRTWIVDASGGSGAHATTIQAGEALASHGDTVIVRAGQYRSFYTNKGIAFVGQGTVVIVPDYVVHVPPSIYIGDIPPAQTCVLRGIDVIAQPIAAAQSGIWIVRAFGRVVLHDVTVNLPELYPSEPGNSPPALFVRDSNHVYLSDCNFHGAPAMSLINARCYSTDVIALGRAAGVVFRTTSLPSYPAIQLQGGELIWSHGRAEGGISGWTTTLRVPASPALVASAASARICGNAGTTFASGFQVAGVATPAIDLIGSRLTLDPRVTVTANSFAGGVRGGPVDRRALASLSARGGDRGGTIRAEVVAPAGDVVALFLGSPGVPFRGPFGEQHIDAATLLLAGATVQGASESFRLDLPVPLAPQLFARSIALQGFRSNQSGTLENSNPAVLLLR
jgi:hypothetical protein